MNPTTIAVVNEIRQLRRAARAWRIAATIGCVAVSVIFLLILRYQALKLIEPGPARTAFLHHLGEGLQRQVLPEARDLGVQTVQALTPRLQAEWIRFQERAPALAEQLTVELELFQKNLPARAEEALQAVLQDAFAQRVAQIRERYPDLTEERVAVLAGLLLTEAETRLSNLAVEIAAPYEEELVAIVADLEHIRITEPAPANAEEAAWELARFCARWLETELDQTASQTPVGSAIVATAFRAPQP